MFGRIILGLVIMILGGGVIYYSANLVETFGRSSRADEHLQGTRNMWMLIGLVLFILGGLVMFGVLGFSNPANIGTSTFE